MVVDDHAIVLHGLKELINSEPDLEVIMATESAEHALDMLREQLPDIVVTDISLPGLSGLELIKAISRLHPKLPTMVLSMHDELVHEPVVQFFVGTGSVRQQIGQRARAVSRIAQDPRQRRGDHAR